MSKIRIKNFGAITSGFAENNGFIDISKISIFIGNQGVGKSTIAKLISIMTWLEKALIRGDLKEKDITRYNRFQKKHCAYKNIHNYFKHDTEIEFQGKSYFFLYQDTNFSISKNDTNSVLDSINLDYKMPKIMYVPAERNLLSVFDRPNLLKNLPNTLHTFLNEFENAKQELKEEVILPFDNIKFKYQKQNKISSIIGENYKIKLSEASSGHQSVIPLFLVSQYLAKTVNQESNYSKTILSVEDTKKIKKKIKKLLMFKDELSEDIIKMSLQVLTAQFHNSCFINIVEEPEKNLFPTTQKNILFKLFEFANSNLANELLITTHSPYIISYLTLAIKSYQVLQKVKNSDDRLNLTEKLNKIIQTASCINPNDACVYEVLDDGSICKLSTYNSLPSDDNFLNQLLAESNIVFDELLDIEELCE
ncbi:MAG: hypothetical protein B6I24_10100 [Bacteroidetes bacterium 4572_128]|nr:MAG: hypothetical protein B6I24_10100 [Bacteroidetes bacterium 4572_128]